MKMSILHGDIFQRTAEIPSDSIDLCITSPPYWGLRNYGVDGQLGAEPTMEAYLDNTMRWVNEVWRVLKPTGSFVLNIGDTFIGGGRRNRPSEKSINCNHAETQTPSKIRGGIYKTKQLLSVSSFAYCRIVSETDFVCRGEHIWAKPNVPSPIRSRLKHSHEKLFWFVKDADKYYFDAKAWMKKISLAYKEEKRTDYSRVKSLVSKQGGERKERDSPHADAVGLSANSCFRSGKGEDYLENKETIEHSWRVVPVGAKANGFELEGKQASEHIAPFPENLIEPYIKSLCPADGTVLDTFLGSGTTMRVAMVNNRNSMGIELNEKSTAYAKKRLNWGQGLNVEYEEKEAMKR